MPARGILRARILLREPAGLRPVAPAYPDIFHGRGLIVRAPKFTESEIPLTKYNRDLRTALTELSSNTCIQVPRFEGFHFDGNERYPEGNYIVVDEVPGESLDRAIAHGAVAPEATQLLTSDLARYLTSVADGTRRSYLEDICHADQYVVSVENGGQAVWLVDIEPRMESLHRDSINSRNIFLAQIGQLIEMFHLTETLGTRTIARDAIEDLLSEVAVWDLSASREILSQLHDPSVDYRTSEWNRRKDPKVEALIASMLEKSSQALTSQTRRGHPG